MSKCISQHGEYSEHQLNKGGTLEEEFVCQWCFALAEDELLAEVERLRAEVKGDRAARAAALREAAEEMFRDENDAPRDGYYALRQRADRIEASESNA